MKGLQRPEGRERARQRGEAVAGQAEGPQPAQPLQRQAGPVLPRPAAARLTQAPAHARRAGDFTRRRLLSTFSISKVARFEMHSTLVSLLFARFNTWSLWHLLRDDGKAASRL